MVQAFVLIQAGVGMASRGGAGRGRDQRGALSRYRDLALRRGRPRRGREHRCAGATGRLEDPGDRGDHPDPDLPRGAALTAARRSEPHPSHQSKALISTVPIMADGFQVCRLSDEIADWRRP
jgi:hypothetical protein